MHLSQVTDHLMIRKGSSKNVMIFPRNDYDNSAFQLSGDKYTFTHNAIGADLARYTWNYGQNWTDWFAIEAVTTIPASVFDHTEEMFWDGAHIIMQCKFLCPNSDFNF